MTESAMPTSNETTTASYKGLRPAMTPAGSALKDSRERAVAMIVLFLSP